MVIAIAWLSFSIMLSQPTFDFVASVLGFLAGSDLDFCTLCSRYLWLLCWSTGFLMACKL